jgi:hypothetical protein
MKILRLVAIAVFVAVWSVQMYLSLFGPLAPSPVNGAIYPVVIHGGVIYATHWQRYLATQSALTLAIVLIGLNILLRRLFNSAQSF